MPVRISEARERSGIGSRNGKLSTGPRETSLPFSETAARRPGNRDGAHAELGEQLPGDRALAAEDVRTEVEPVLAARLGEDPPAGPVGRLEHDDVEVAECVGGRQPGDPAADDDDVGHR